MSQLPSINYPNINKVHYFQACHWWVNEKHLSSTDESNYSLTHFITWDKHNHCFSHGTLNIELINNHHVSFIDYNMTVWIFGETVVIAPDGGMCKTTIPGVKQSRASQWRARASRRLGANADMVYCDYA